MMFNAWFVVCFRYGNFGRFFIRLLSFAVFVKRCFYILKSMQFFCASCTHSKSHLSLERPSWSQSSCLSQGLNSSNTISVEERKCESNYTLHLLRRWSEKNQSCWKINHKSQMCIFKIVFGFGSIYQLINSIWHFI